ncbi:MAG: amidohydrolase family protein [Myxococcales bacterium]|nr:amidohydrolase family protein [Myxococcales bacterium]
MSELEAVELARLDCDGARVEPARINAHTHIYSGLAPLDMPPPEPSPENFVQILERVWWRLDRALDERSLRAAARLYVAEALLAGTTVLIDHHESPRFIAGSLDVLADACRELGARALLCYGASERNDGRAEAQAGLRECARFIQSLDAGEPLLRGAVALHASFTVSDATVREAGALARELGSVMHVHLAEDVADVEDARARGYAGPLERLLELDALPRGSILAHGVHLDAAQVRRAEAAGLWLVQNPRSNRGNRVGYPAHLRQSAHVALGTDGYPADMTVEAAALRAEARDRDDPEPAVSERITGGARLASELWSLPLGALPDAARPEVAADLRVLDDRGVRHVIAAGRVVVRDHALQTADLSEIRRAAAEAAPRLWSRMMTL